VHEVSGHDFSRADKANKINGALAPAVIVSCVCHSATAILQVALTARPARTNSPGIVLHGKAGTVKHDSAKNERAVLDRQRRASVSSMAKMHKSRLAWSQQQRLMEHLQRNQSDCIPKPLHSSRRDQQGAATLHGN
ncbi:MAG: hypothetical protein ACLQG3_18335, partial [Terracidiphilus sp.]